MTRARSAYCAAALLAALAGRAQAQAVPEVRGPTRAAAMIGARPIAATPLLAPAAPAPVFQGNNNKSHRGALVLMLVGGTGILVGSLVNDNDAGTIIIVGGAIIGLYGLYQFLR